MTTLATPKKQELTATTTQLGCGLYLLTLLLELPGVLARYITISLVFGVLGAFNRIVLALWLLANQLTGNTQATTGEAVNFGGELLASISSMFLALGSTRDIVVFLVCWFPLVASLLTFVLPGGFFLRRFALGGRPLSQREREAVELARQNLSSHNQGVRWPTHIYVLDKQGFESYVIGTTLYLSSALIQSPYLSAQIAHSLGHINSIDGQLVLAIRRFVLLPVYLASRAIGQAAPGIYRITTASSDSATGCLAAVLVWLFSLVVSLGGGGFGLWVLNLAWAWFWRQREYAADRYAADLGQQANLVGYLESRGPVNETLFDIATPYLVLQPPPLELRIDRLSHPENYDQSDQVDLRPLVIGLVAAFAVLCAFPATTSALARWAHNVEGTWQVTGACGYQGCVPSDNLAGGRNPATVYLTDGEVYGTYTDNTYGYLREGTYVYIDHNTIYFDTRGDYGFPVRLNGEYDVERRGDTLILRNQSETIALESGL